MKLTPISISLAGIKLIFSMRSKGLAKAIQRRYKGYLKPAKTCHLKLSVVCTRGYFDHPQDVVITGGAGATYTLNRRDFKCSWHGTVGEIHLHESIYAFDACLRIILATIMVHHNGVLLHSSSIAMGKNAYIFSGRSEAGKTTISRLSGKKVLNDEIVAVKLNSSGTPYVYGTPFWGEMGTGPVYASPYKLRGIYFLNKSKQVKKENLSVLESINAFLQVVCYFDQKPDNVQVLMDLCFRIMNATNLYKLYFDKSDKFLDVL